ncbi:protein STABILIZED1 [Trifolium repens]|nr:protein STABILIZED1 [Trifolium repens]
MFHYFHKFLHAWPQNLNVNKVFLHFDLLIYFYISYNLSNFNDKTVPFAEAALLFGSNAVTCSCSCLAFSRRVSRTGTKLSNLFLFFDE